MHKLVLTGPPLLSDLHWFPLKDSCNLWVTSCPLMLHLAWLQETTACVQQRAESPSRHKKMQVEKLLYSAAGINENSCQLRTNASCTCMREIKLDEEGLKYYVQLVQTAISVQTQIFFLQEEVFQRLAKTFSHFYHFLSHSNFLPF